MFWINYHTGAGNVYDISSLEKAKEIADSESAYTQQDIDICKSGSTEPVMSRRWYGVAFDPDLFEDGEDAKVIKFGDFGYYGEWQ